MARAWRHLRALLLVSFLSSTELFVQARRALLPCVLALGGVARAVDLGYEKQDGLKKGLGKKRTLLEGYTALPSGLQLKDVNGGRNGSAEVKPGDFVVFTWEGKASLRAA